MPFPTLGEAEAAAVEVARTDPTAKLHGGVGIVQELATGLYRLVIAPLDQAPVRGAAYTNVFGHEERLVAYIKCNDVRRRWKRAIFRAVGLRRFGK